MIPVIVNDPSIFPKLPEPFMRVMVVNRAQGKTTRALEWLRAGKPILHAPGWSRILVEPHQAAADHARELVTKLGWFSKEQAKHIIVTVSDLPFLQVPTGGCEFAFDNLDLMLPRTPGPVTFATMTGLAVFQVRAVICWGVLGYAANFAGFRLVPDSWPQALICFAVGFGSCFYAGMRLHDATLGRRR